MNCDACRQLLSMSAEVESAPAEAWGHLADCPDCRAWQQQLALIEENVRRLPVPPSQPGKFLESILADPPDVAGQDHPPVAATAPAPAAGSAPPAPPPGPPQAPLPVAGPVAVVSFAPPPVVPLVAPPRWSGQRWLVAVGGSAAAAALLIACGIFLGNLVSSALQRDEPVAANKELDPTKDVKVEPGEPEPPKTLLAVLLASNLGLAEAETPRERVEELAKIARALYGEAPKLARAAAPKEMEKLATLYARVIREGVVPRARSLPREERRTALGAIAGELARAGQEAEELAKTAPGTAASLRALAAAARDGDAQLRGLMGEGAE